MTPNTTNSEQWVFVIHILAWLMPVMRGLLVLIVLGGIYTQARIWTHYNKNQKQGGRWI